MKPRALHLSASIAAGAALALAGCGGGGGEGTGTGGGTGAGTGQGQPPAQTQTVSIGLTEFSISPSSPTVRPGTVEFNVTNRGGSLHALEVEGPAGEIETRDLQSGQSQIIAVPLERPGTYTMYCPVGNHRQQGMEGKVVVR